MFHGLTPLHRDYKGLKKRVKAIRRQKSQTTSSPTPTNPRKSPVSASQDRPAVPSDSPDQRITQRSPSITIAESAKPRSPNDLRNLRSTTHRPYGATGKTPPLAGKRPQVSPTSPFSLPPAHETPEIMALPPPARSMSDIVVSAVVSHCIIFIHPSQRLEVVKQ